MGHFPRWCCLPTTLVIHSGVCGKYTVYNMIYGFKFIDLQKYRRPPALPFYYESAQKSPLFFVAIASETLSIARQVP
jgi:hypothetical protein